MSWKENLVKHWKVSKCYNHDCRKKRFINLIHNFIAYATNYNLYILTFLCNLGSSYCRFFTSILRGVQVLLDLFKFFMIWSHHDIIWCFSIEYDLMRFSSIIWSFKNIYDIYWIWSNFLQIASKWISFIFITIILITIAISIISFFSLVLVYNNLLLLIRKEL